LLNLDKIEIFGQYLVVYKITSYKSFMAKNKGIRILITLECTECRSNLNKRSPGVSRYLTQKNRRNNPERLELKKYCPHCNKPTIHKEIK
jgi:large subunit ribosomal protein L33